MERALGGRSTTPCSTQRAARTKLRALRARGEAWDARFVEKDPRFWPVASGAKAFTAHADWPDPAEYSAAFSGAPRPVRFVADDPSRRTRRRPVDPGTLYDGRVVRGEVPTRARSWHDFLNALVWSAFPRAKMALHRAQHTLIRRWIPAGADRLPNARTREHDALALIDEGGVLVLRAPSGAEKHVPFGHALFEGLVLGTGAMIARAVLLPVGELPADPLELVALADHALAARLESPVLPEELARVAF